MRKVLFIMILLAGLSGVCEAANVSTSPYGINVHQVDNEVLRKVKDAGIKWIRVGASWAGTEPARGLYDWTQLDRITAYADSNDLSVLLVVAYTPGWANNNRGIKYPADNVADWENFVRIIVNRYKDRVKYWNLWNEPNSEDFFGEGKDVFVDQVFLPAARVVRDADPAAFIVGPELAHLTSGNSEWYFWMKYILEQAGDYIDIVSHHIYKNEGVYYIYELLEAGETLIPSVQEIIRDTGHQSKQFWITETGWDTANFSEDVQAERYLQMLQERREKLYPHKIFFYEIIDDPAPGISPWGILRSDRSEKPAYVTYKDYIAGKLPGGNGGTTEEPAKKPCFAEQVGGAGNGGRSQVKNLNALRLARDEISRDYPAARALVQLYYKMSDEMTGVSFSDSRLLHLGVKVIENSNRFIDKYRQSYLTRKVNPEVIAAAEQMLELLKDKNTSPMLKQVAAWGEKQLSYIKTMPLEDYFRLHLHKEVQVLENFQLSVEKNSKEH